MTNVWRRHQTVSSLFFKVCCAFRLAQQQFLTLTDICFVSGRANLLTLSSSHSWLLRLGCRLSYPCSRRALNSAGDWHSFFLLAFVCCGPPQEEQRLRSFVIQSPVTLCRREVSFSGSFYRRRINPVWPAGTNVVLDFLKFAVECRNWWTKRLW